MSDLTAHQLAAGLIETAKNQYRGGHYDLSLETLARVKDIYRDAFVPLPKNLEPVIAMVEKARDMEKLKLTNW